MKTTCLPAVLAAGLAAMAAPAADWMLKQSGTPAFYGVDAYNASTGCAVGAEGAIWQTTDGWQTWTARTVGVYDFFSAEFTTPECGWVAGWRLHATTNGGATWTQQTNVNQALRDIHFLTPSNGLVVGGGGKILRTTDGVHWQSVSNTAGAGTTLYAIDFVSATQGWVVGYGTVLATVDGGQTWTNLPTGLSGGIYGADFLSATQGWAVGQDQRIWFTADGGRAWTTQYMGTTAYDLYDVCMLNARCGFAAGRNGAILRTTNGVSWEEMSNPGAPLHVEDLDFPDAAHGFAVGNILGSQGNLLTYTEPGRVTGLVWPEGRTNASQVAVTAAAGATNAAATDAAGEFAVDAPDSVVRLRAAKAGYLFAENTNLTVAAGASRRMMPVTLPAGDVNGDRTVDTNDLAAIAAQLGGNLAAADLNGDGAVDVRDLVLAARNDGEQAPRTWAAARPLTWVRPGGISVSQPPGTNDFAGRFAPDLVALGGGAFRLYYSGTDGTNTWILSLYSANGTNWAPEPGIRVAPWASYDDVYSPHLVRTGTNAWRMYFSARTRSPAAADIFSAVTTNGLEFDLEAGTRVAHGGTYDAAIAQSPCVYRRRNGTAYVFPDGALRMLYGGHDGTNAYVLMAASTNGLEWVKGASPVRGGAALSAGAAQTALATPSFYGLLDVLDVMLTMEEDGSFSMRYSQLAGDGSGGTNRLWTGIIQLWSPDGFVWPEDQEVRIDLPPDGNGGSGGSGGMTEPMWMGSGFGVFFGSLDAPGSNAMSSAMELGDDAGPTLRLLQARPRSIAESELLCAYDLSSLPSWLLVGSQGLYIGATAVTDHGHRAPNMVSSLEELTQTQGVVNVKLTYAGHDIFVSKGYELYLWKKTGEMLTSKPEFVYWQAYKGLLASLDLKVLASRRVTAGHIFRCLAVGDIPATYLFAGQGQALNRANLASASLGRIVLSDRFPERRLWIPGSGGSVEVLSQREAPSLDSRQVPDGPYFATRVKYSYYNIWGYSGKLGLEVRNHLGEPVTKFKVDAPAVRPTKGHGDAATNLLSRLDYAVGTVNAYYTNRITLVGSTVRAQLLYGAAVLAEDQVMKPVQGLSIPEPLEKRWEPAARVTLANIAVSNRASNEAGIEFDYTCESLPNIPSPPMVVAEAVDAGGTPVDAGFPLCTMRLRDGSRRARMTLTYDGVDHGPSTASIRLSAQVPDVALVQQQAAFAKTWTAPDVGYVALPADLADNDAGPVRFPCRNGPEMWVDTLASCWVSSETHADLQLQLLDGLRVDTNFLCESVAVTSRPSTHAFERNLTNSPVYHLTALYTGSGTNHTTTGFRIVLTSPDTGREVEARNFMQMPATWNPPSTGSLAWNYISVTHDTPYEAKVNVKYSYHTAYDEPACILLDWCTNAPDGSPVPVRGFSDEPLAISNYPSARPAYFDVTHFAPQTQRTDVLKLTMLAGVGGVGRVLDEAVTNYVFTWDPPPSYQLEVASVTNLGINNTALLVRVGYSLTNAGDDVTHRLRIRAMAAAIEDEEQPEYLDKILGLYTITNPAAAVGHVQYAEVPVVCSNRSYNLRSYALRVAITQNGDPIYVGTNQTRVRIYHPYAYTWHTNTPGVIERPTVIPISPGEAWVVAPYEFTKKIQDCRPVIEVFEGTNNLSTGSQPLFTAETAPVPVRVPTGGTNGVILGHVYFSGGTPITTDKIQVSLLDTNDLAIVLSASSDEQLAWSRRDPTYQSGTWSDAADATNYYLRNLNLTRPNPHTVRARIEYGAPEHYTFNPMGAPTLRAFLWSGLKPLYAPADEYKAKLSEGEADRTKTLFSSRDLVIGGAPQRSLSGGEVEAAVDGAGSGSAGGSFSTIGGYVLTFGTNTFDLVYEPMVGNLDVTAITFCFYGPEVVCSNVAPPGEDAVMECVTNEIALWSRTFNIDPAQQVVYAPDQVCPDIGGQRVIFMDNDKVPTYGELHVMVPYVNNAGSNGVSVWIEPFPDATATNPYAPLELVQLVGLLPGASGLATTGGVTASGAPFVRVTNGVGMVMYRFRLAGFDIQETLDFPLEAVLGAPRSGTVHSHYDYPFDLDWRQLCDLDDSRVRVEPGEYVNQVNVWDMRYKLSQGVPRPCYLFAKALTNGVPISGMQCEPVAMDNPGEGAALAAHDEPLVLEFNFADAATNILRADELQFYVSSDPQPRSWTMLCNRFYKPQQPLVWHRQPVEIRVETTVVENATAETVDYSFRLLDTGDPAVPHVFTTLRPGEYIGSQIKALRFLQDLPDPIESVVVEHHVTSTAQGWRDSDVLLQFDEGDAPRTVSTQLGVYLDVYRDSAHGGGREKVRGLGYTVVDHVKLWINADSFIIGSLDQLVVKDDGDGSIRGMGEDLITCVGVTGGAELQEMLTNTNLDESVRQEVDWPYERDKNSRWLKTDADNGADTWDLDLPLFVQREMNMKPAMGLSLILLDDDAIPSFVSALIDLVFKAAALVADYFGQSWLMPVLEFVNNFVDNMVAQDAATDRIESAGFVGKYDTGWGISMTSTERADAMWHERDGAGMTASFSTRRIVLPPEPKGCRVKLKSLRILDDSDDWGEGEMKFGYRVMDGLNPRSEGHLPESGTRGMDTGETYGPDKVIFDRPRVGPFLYIEVNGWDDDEPSIGDDHDCLGVINYTLYPHEGDWFQGTITYTNTARREGAFEAVVEIQRY